MAARSLLGAAAAGALSMYLLDPEQGRHRRAAMRDRLASGMGRLDDVPDEVLCERVGYRLAGVVSHPGAIEASVLSGKVTLSGVALEREYLRLIRTVWAIRGVVDVDDRLAVYESAAGIPALQGGVKPREFHFGSLRESWAPRMRVVAGALGAALIINALAGRRSALGFLGGLGGTALIARSSTNMPIDRLVGVRRPAMELHGSIDVLAPVERVFAAFSQLERFPELMKHVREVRVRGDGTSRWVVEGPAGGTVSWDAVTTRLEPNKLIAWRTLPWSTVEHAGLLRFESMEGGTRVFVTMIYTPPAGAIGHAVARLFGADPESELNDDLMRMKVFLETGHSAHDAAVARH